MPTSVLQALGQCMLGSHVPHLRAFLVIGTLASGAYGPGKALADPLFSSPTDRRFGALELAPSVLDLNLNRRDQAFTLNAIKRRTSGVMAGDVGSEVVSAGCLMETAARACGITGDKEGIGRGSMRLRGGATSRTDAAPSHDNGMDSDSEGAPHFHTDETDAKVNPGKKNSRKKSLQQRGGRASNHLLPWHWQVRKSRQFAAGVADEKIPGGADEQGPAGARSALDRWVQG